MGGIGSRFVRDIQVIDKQDFRPASLSRLCDIEDWESPAFNSIACDILDLGKTTVATKHRKLWEFAVCAQALQEGGVLNSKSSGLSVAAGCERILYYLAHKVDRIIATDIYGSGSFSDLEAVPEVMLHPDKFAPYDYPKERLRALYMNAFSLRFPSSLFDFCICLSSIEHFGGLGNSIKAVQEMGRVVRRGGIVVLTTECSINGKRALEVFTPNQLRQMIRESGLSLVGDLELKLTKGSLEYLADMHRDDLNHLPHINLRAFGADFTSVCLVLRKEGSFCFEGDALEKRRDYLDSFAALSQLCSLDRDYDKQEKSKLAYRVRQWIRKKMTSLRVRRDVHLSLETWLLNRQRKNNR